jgi:endoglucanase
MTNSLFLAKNKVKLIAFILLFSPFLSKAQLPAAMEISRKMGRGINLGNTLEAICDESAWGAAKTTQQLIDSIKASGFSSVRLPVSWFCHSDTVTSMIDLRWMARVKDVVDYCIKDSLYVVLNMHWDKGWLENRIKEKHKKQVNARLQKYWKQIALYFKDYNEYLLFAGANEPNAHDKAATEILMTYYQTFVNTVRATGGNNRTRTLIVQGPETDIEKTLKFMDKLPKDVVKDRLMMEVHFYSPYPFCLMNKDADWGKMAYYWGKPNHSKTDTLRNSSWGEEAFIDKLYDGLKTKFMDKGIPVIIGEFGAYKRKLSAADDQDLHNRSVDYFLKYVSEASVSRGMIPFYWDTPNCLYNRQTGEVLDRGMVRSLTVGKGNK